MKLLVAAIFPDQNIARAEDGASCHSSSYSDNHTCLNTLVGDNSYWQTNGEGPGAWIKVSFPRANVAQIGLLSGCDFSRKIKSLLAVIETLDFQVFWGRLCILNRIFAVQETIYAIGYTYWHTSKNMGKYGLLFAIRKYVCIILCYIFPPRTIPGDIFRYCH